jgi:crossover junction endodeoxyribonuclease RuvC
VSKIILGVDPGLTRLGVAVIESSSSRKVALKFVNTFKTSPELELSQRIGQLGSDLESLIKTYKPSTIALERVFAQANLRSVMGVAQISGVVIFLAQKYSIPLEMHTPSEVKAAVTGSGRAQKAQMGIAVAKILGLAEVPKPADSADAIAIAICNAWRSPVSTKSDAVQTKAQTAWKAAERVATRNKNA